MEGQGSLVSLRAKLHFYTTAKCPLGSRSAPSEGFMFPPKVDQIQNIGWTRALEKVLSSSQFDRPRSRSSRRRRRRSLSRMSAPESFCRLILEESPFASNIPKHLNLFSRKTLDASQFQIILEKKKSSENTIQYNSSDLCYNHLKSQNQIFRVQS